MKKTALLIAAILVLVALTGCNMEKANNPELINKALDKATEMTQQAINNKDVKLARSLWGQISEMGVKVNELGEKKLSESIGKLASTYVHLVEYIEKKDDKQLQVFNEKYNQAVSELKTQIELYKKRTIK